MAFCTKCGAQVPDGSTFCTSCGAPIAAAAAAPEQPAPAQATPEQPQQQAAPQPQQQYQQYQQQQQQQFQQPYQQPGQQQYQQYQQYQQPVGDQYDHTAEFDRKDISDNKIIAMAPYLLSVVGVIIALLASGESRYVAFHVRQALKLQITEILSVIIMVVPILGWIAGGIMLVILEVLNIIAFFQVCSGKAKEPAIVRSFGFMR